MQLIYDLDDTRKFRKVEGCRVFAPHERHFPARLIDGKEIPARTVRVTLDDLHEIARNTNRAYSDYAQLVKLTLGHRNPGAVPEWQQPIEVGYARNFRVENRQVPSGKFLTVLVCDEYHRVEHLQLCANASGRSVEYLVQFRLVSGIALLTRDSALQLGFVSLYALGQGASPVLCYSMGSAMPEEKPIVQDPPKPYSDDIGEWTPENEQEYMRYKRYAKRYAMEQQDAQKPPVKPEEKPAEGAPNPAANYQAGFNPVVYSLTQKVAELERQAAAANCARLLDTMQGRVKFDYQRELTQLLSYSKDQDRAAHVQYMLDNYEKMPMANGAIPIAYSGNYQPRDEGKPSNHDEAMAYLRAHPGTSYEAALAKTKK